MSYLDHKYSFSGSDCKAFAYFPGRYSSIATHRSAEYEKKKAELQEIIDTTAQLIEEYAKQIAAASTEEKASPIRLQLEAASDLRTNTWKQRLRLQHENTLWKLKHNPDPVLLDSLATISISVHEPKAPVRALGHRGVKGFSRSVRTIAGSMIFIVIDGHPLEKLMLLDPASTQPHLVEEARREYAGFRNWSEDSMKGIGTNDKRRYTSTFVKTPAMISPFNLLLRYSSEYLPHGTAAPITIKDINKKRTASTHIKNIEFLGEGIVTSVNDMVTEVVVQFVAEDYYEFSHYHGEDNQDVLQALRAQALNADTEHVSEADIMRSYFEQES